LPALIEKDMFYKVQNSMNDRAPKHPPQSDHSHYLLSGLVRCNKCGAAYIGYGAKSGQFHYYVCGTTYSKGKEICPSQHLPKDRVEKFVTDKIRDHLLTDENLTDLVKLCNEELDGSIKNFKERIEIIDSEVEQWQGRLERLYDFVETRTIDPARMGNRIAEVQDKIEELRRSELEIEEALHTRRLEPIGPKIVLDYVKGLKEFLDESNIFERRAFLRSFVESIDVDDHQITLNYTMPLPPDNVKQEAFSVLGIVPPSPLGVSIGRTPTVSIFLPSGGTGRL
jgi:site-specific DNA recombinase